MSKKYLGRQTTGDRVSLGTQREEKKSMGQMGSPSRARRTFQRGWWEESAKDTWLGLTLPTLTFYVSYGSMGEEDPIMADAGKHLRVRDERSDNSERGRKEAKRSERTRNSLEAAGKRSHGPWANEPPLWASVSSVCGWTHCFLPRPLAHM